MESYFLSDTSHENERIAGQSSNAKEKKDKVHYKIYKN